MIIEGEDFRMEHVEDSTQFDLYTIHVVNAKSEEKRREELKLVGYSLSITSCLQHIINYRLSKNKETYTLKEYLKDYKAEAKLLTDLIDVKWEDIEKKIASLE